LCRIVRHLGSGIIADNLSEAGWSWGYVSAVDLEGRTIWIVDAHRGNGKRFAVRADEKLTVFLELETAIRGAHSETPSSKSNVHCWNGEWLAAMCLSG